jgi:hypothetical protein
VEAFSGGKMKYQVGDLVLVKHCEYKPLPRLRPRLRLPLRLPLHPLPRLNNTYGVITAVEKHNEIFKENSTENDNGYIWYSQVDGKEYHFYEDEVDGEVVK